LGARKAFQGINNPEETQKWLELPFIGIGISTQVKPLVDRRILTAAVVSSLTMELALRLLVRALDSQIRPPDRSVVDVSSYPALERLSAKA
jgi:multisubunit Na+/H+ antiporter MnhC subunit